MGGAADWHSCYIMNWHRRNSRPNDNDNSYSSSSSNNDKKKTDLLAMDHSDGFGKTEAKKNNCRWAAVAVGAGQLGGGQGGRDDRGGVVDGA